MIVYIFLREVKRISLPFLLEYLKTIYAIILIKNYLKHKKNDIKYMIIGHQTSNIIYACSTFFNSFQQHDINLYYL
jgi:hypothetical protein